MVFDRLLAQLWMELLDVIFWMAIVVQRCLSTVFVSLCLFLGLGAPSWRFGAFEVTLEVCRYLALVGAWTFWRC